MDDLQKVFGLIRGEKYAGFWFSVEGAEWHGRAFFSNDGWRVFYSGKPTPEAALADLVSQIEQWKNRPKGGGP